MHQKKTFGLSKNVFYLGIVSFLTDISSEMIAPILPLFLTGTLKAGKTVLGLMEGVAESASAFIKMYAGILSDRMKRVKALVVAGYSLSNLTKPLYVLASSVFGVIAVRIIDRIGKGLRSSPRDVLIVESSGKGELGRSFGFHRSADNFGELLGPAAAALFLFLGFSYQNIFLLSAVPGIAAVLIIIFLVKEQEREIVPAVSEHSKVLSLPSPREILRLVPTFPLPFKLFIGSTLVFSLANFSKMLLMPRAVEMGTPIAMVPLIFLASPLCSTVLAFPLGILSDRLGRRLVLLWGYVVFIAMAGVFLFGTSIYFAALGFLLHGIFFAMSDGAQRAFTSDLAPIEMRGTALGIYHMVVGIAVLPANLIAGSIWQLFGAELMFGVSMILCVIGAVLLLKVKDPNSMEVAEIR